MGLVIVAKNADFSANPVGHVGLYTTITDALESLFESRRSAGKSIHNSAPDKPDASVTGAPTFSATSAVCDISNKIVYPSKPSGDHTIAIVMKTQNGGTNANSPAGAMGAALATTGGSYFAHYNWRMEIKAMSYASAATPLSGATTITAGITTDASARHELFIATVKSGVGVSLYQPRTAAAATTATTRLFAQNIPQSFRTVPGGSASFEDLMFAHWSKVLSAGEIDTFYAEMKEQFARIGVAI